MHTLFFSLLEIVILLITTSSHQKQYTKCLSDTSTKNGFIKTSKPFGHAYNKMAWVSITLVVISKVYMRYEYRQDDSLWGTRMYLVSGTVYGLHLSTKGYSIYSIYFTTCRLWTWYDSSKPIGCVLGASTDVHVRAVMQILNCIATTLLQR